jgi:tRNA (cytidine/uridine-2'-O-)-methyltransferase
MKRHPPASLLFRPHGWPVPVLAATPPLCQQHFAAAPKALGTDGMRIALYQPDIAGNVGAILRTAACLGAGVDLIEPMGFQWDDRRVARAGMDYIDHVAVTRHADWDAFAGQARARLVLLTTRGATLLHDFTFAADDILLFGRESAGVPEEVHERADARVVIPMAPPLRSLNLSVSAAIVLAEALRQTGGWPGQIAASTECPASR